MTNELQIIAEAKALLWLLSMHHLVETMYKVLRLAPDSQCSANTYCYDATLWPSLMLIPIFEILVLPTYFLTISE